MFGRKANKAYYYHYYYYYYFYYYCNFIIPKPVAIFRIQLHITHGPSTN